MIRAFLFDIGNVLLRFDFALALKKLGDLSEVHDPAEVMAAIDRIKWSYEDGQIDRAAFLRGVVDVLRYRGTEDELVAAWQNIFEPNQPMLDVVEKLHGRFPLFLLSNTSDIHIDHVFRVYPVFQRFDGGIYSHRVLASKPGAEIYRIAVREFRLRPETTLFIDDLLPNVETAKRLGFLTHHYHHDQHALLLAELTAYGAL